MMFKWVKRFFTKPDTDDEWTGPLTTLVEPMQCNPYMVVRDTITVEPIILEKKE